MKKITYTIALVVLATFVSCKNETKSTDTDVSDTTEKNITTQDVSDENKKSERVYIVRSDSTNVSWTAYKTTGKVAVGGQFTSIDFKTTEGATIAEAFNNLEFTIPVSGLFTDNEDRDKKLIASFFDVMLDTKNITGKLSFDKDDLCTATILMNGKNNDVKLSYFAAENEVVFTAELNLEDWDATGVLKTLNIACGELHKGADGISKTWTEIAIKIITKY